MQYQSRRAGRAPAKQKRSFLEHHRVMTLLICLVLITIATSFISYLDWREWQQEQRRAEEQAKQEAFMKVQVQKAIEQRFANARQAEAEARSISSSVLAQMYNASAS